MGEIKGGGLVLEPFGAALEMRKVATVDAALREASTTASPRMRWSMRWDVVSSWDMKEGVTLPDSTKSISWGCCAVHTTPCPPRELFDIAPHIWPTPRQAV